MLETLELYARYVNAIREIIIGTSLSILVTIAIFKILFTKSTIKEVIYKLWFGKQ